MSRILKKLKNFSHRFYLKLYLFRNNIKENKEIEKDFRKEFVLLEKKNIDSLFSKYKTNLDSGEYDGICKS